jgi:ABC-type uncharacterized transport system ATPase subunit
LIPRTSDGSEALVRFEKVTKRFGEVVANNNVTFDIGRGEVLALVGENGAGKSTIVNILGGLYRPDAGAITFDGRPIEFSTPVDAIRSGIGVVHQHYALVPSLTALENVALAVGELGLGAIDRRALSARIGGVAGRLGFTFDLNARVSSFDVAQQQQVEIVKALMHDVKLLLLDEPTAVLTPQDRKRLFETIARLKQHGTSIVLITHKLEDVFAVTDRAVILRRGAVVADRPTRELTDEAIVSAMIGEPPDAATVHEIVAHKEYAGIAGADNCVLARLESVDLSRANGAVVVSGVSMDVRAGEILAVAGVDGNGQSEFVLALAGMARPHGGRIECLELASDRAGWSPRSLRRRGLAHIPEDRRRDGMVAGMSLTRNYLLTRLFDAGESELGLVRERVTRSRMQTLIDRFAVTCRGPDDPMGRLSGGNQQKVVLARELDGKPRLILAAHPSRGLDIKTIRFVHELLRTSRAEGCGIVLVSSDLDEILALADRVVAFAAGQSFGPLPRAEVGRSELGRWIAGKGAAA